MARLEWVILTERTIIEAQSNAASLLSIVETVTIPTPPPLPGAADGQNAPPFFVPFRFYVNQQWVRSKLDRNETVETRCLLLAPDKKSYATAFAIVSMEGKFVRNRVVGQIPGFPLKGEGEYSVLVQLRSGKRWRTVGKTQFVLVFGPAVATATH